MGKRVSPNNLSRLWNNMKTYVRNNSFSEARLDINNQTGHLIAQEGGNLKFSLDETGHLISEVV